MGVVVFLAATVVACGSSHPGSGSGGTGGGASGGTGGNPACGIADGPTSGDTCNAIAAGGPCVTGAFSTAAAPAPAGGALAGGTYNLVSETFHGSAEVEQTFLPGQPFRHTVVLSDVTATSFTIDQVWISGTVAARAHETAAVSGMTATFTQICPPADAGGNWDTTTDFTATSSSITLFWSTVGVIEVRVFNKAP